MRVVLGTFNDMNAQDKNIVGPKECLEDMIKEYKRRSFKYKEDLKLSMDECFVTSQPEDRRRNESDSGFYERITSLNRNDAYGQLSNFEIIEVKQDYLFNKLILLADYEEWEYRDTGFKLRATAAPLNVEVNLDTNTDCVYKIKHSIKEIIAFDLVSGHNKNEEISDDNPRIDLRAKTYRTNGFDHFSANTPLLKEDNATIHLSTAPTNWFGETKENSILQIAPGSEAPGDE